MAGAVVAVLVLAELVRSQQSAWERVSRAPLVADEESGPNGGRAQVVCRSAFRDEPGSAVEEEPRKGVAHG